MTSCCQNMLADWICGNVILSTVVCGTFFAELDTILVFNIFYEVFGEEPALQWRRQHCVPDSLSLKPGSGAIEGVQD